MNGDFVEIVAVGDTAAGYEPPRAMFEHVGHALRRGDLRFAQVETLFSERGCFQGQAMGHESRLHPRRAEVYKEMPFEVVSLASNHTGDWGPEAVDDSVETFDQLGIAAIGAGRLTKARTPAIITRKGLRVAFLAYCSVLLPQSWATEARAGAAPLRVKTYYEPYEYQPGAPARIVTIPDQGDLEQMQEDVRRARQEADCVVVSMHWGIHFVPKPLTDYQPVVARAAIDAGAAAILGHHPHLLQGVAMYKGAVIFYGLGNFAFFRKHRRPSRCLPNAEYSFDQVYDREVAPDYTYRWNQFWAESLVAYIQVDRAGVKQVSVLPTVANVHDQPEVVLPGTRKFEEMRQYLLWASRGIEGGIEDLRVEGDRWVAYQR